MTIIRKIFTFGAGFVALGVLNSESGGILSYLFPIWVISALIVLVIDGWEKWLEQVFQSFFILIIIVIIVFAAFGSVSSAFDWLLSLMQK